MKCAHCGTDADYKARQATGRCRQCARPFAFEPRRDRGMTDLTFKLALEGVSERGELLWTDNHLYYDICRRVRRRRIFHRLVRRPLVSLDRAEFDALYGRWLETNGVPAGRLERPQFGAEVPERPPNVDAYGFERLLVCEHDATADVLLANGFHADARCPVLSYRGYPEHVYEALVPLLRDRPPASVVVVHDASWEGCSLARRVAESPRWFAGVELPHVVDAGLRPADAKRFRGLYQRPSSGRGDGDEAAIDPQEAKWLASHRLELAVVRPRVLMAVLARALRGEASGGAGDEGVGWAVLPWEDEDDEVG